MQVMFWGEWCSGKLQIYLEIDTETGADILGTLLRPFYGPLITIFFYFKGRNIHTAEARRCQGCQLVTVSWMRRRELDEDERWVNCNKVRGGKIEFLPVCHRLPCEWRHPESEWKSSFANMTAVKSLCFSKPFRFRSSLVPFLSCFHKGDRDLWWQGYLSKV